jgi:hypothetical protein
MKQGPYLSDFLSGQLRIFAKEFVRNRRYDILKLGGDKLINKSELLKSIDGKTTINEAEGLWMMRVWFNPSGRYQDMKRQYDGHAGGTDMIKELEEWAKKEGVEKFKKGKFVAKYAKMNDQAIFNQIAWGIVKKLNRTQKTQSIKWYNKGKTKDINNFYEIVVLRGISDAIAADAKNIIENGLSN